MLGICGSSTYPRHAQGSWWDEVVGFFLVFCFSGGEPINLTLVFIAYELFDELTNFFPVAFNLHEVHVLIFTVVIFLVRKRVSLPQLCMRAARSPLPPIHVRLSILLVAPWSQPFGIGYSNRTQM